MENAFKVYEEEFAGGLKGDILFLNMKQLQQDYKYVGLWYACDKNEETFITTEFYYTSEADCKRPPDFSEQLKENSFKKTSRFKIPDEHDCVWVATRIDQKNYCKIKAFALQKEKTYIDYKVIRHRGQSYDTLKNGIIKGCAAQFFKMGIEDRTGTIDYNDTIMFVVFIKELPPADWNFDGSCFGIQKLPIFVPTFIFSIRSRYSNWYGQNPLDDIRT